MNWKHYTLFGVLAGWIITVLVGAIFFTQAERFGVVSSISTSDTLNTTRLAINDLIKLATNFSTTTTNAFNTTGTTTFAGGLYAVRIAAPYFNATSTTATSTFRGGVFSSCFSTDGTNCIANITLPVAIASGGTATTTGGNTNGVSFYDGTRITNDSDFLFSGTKLTIHAASSTYFSALTSMWIPTSTNYTFVSSGQLAINVTQASTSLRWHDGTAERVVNDAVWKTFTISSSTIQQWGGTTAATGTIPMGISGRGETFLKIRCFADPTGLFNTRWGDGTNWMDFIKCQNSTTTAELTDADGINDDDGSISNSAFTFYEPRYIQVGVITPGAGGISISVLVRDTAD